jgi:hypothetical protein
VLFILHSYGKYFYGPEKEVGRFQGISRVPVQAIEITHHSSRGLVELASCLFLYGDSLYHQVPNHKQRGVHPIYKVTADECLARWSACRCSTQVRTGHTGLSAFINLVGSGLAREATTGMRRSSSPAEAPGLCRYPEGRVVCIVCRS